MIRFTAETVWICGEARFFLEKASFRSADYKHSVSYNSVGQTHDICIMACADCMMVHSARKNIINKDYGSEIELSVNPSEEKTLPCDI